jgi:hypothetical protein
MSGTDGTRHQPLAEDAQSLTVSEMATARGFSLRVKQGFALNLDNLARRSIIPKVGERWHGWRRGLARILFDLGVGPEIASKILRLLTARSRDVITSC